LLESSGIENQCAIRFAAQHDLLMCVQAGIWQWPFMCGAALATMASTIVINKKFKEEVQIMQEICDSRSRNLQLTPGQLEALTSLHAIQG
jgi:hypothetical protein